MAINNMTYKNGKIYCIRNIIDDDIYVGSTTQLLCKRMAEHRNKMKATPQYKLYMKMVDVGLDKFYIELIENYPCDNREELRKREGFYIREMGTLNNCIAGRTKTEYFIEHREKITEYSKQYQTEFYNNNKSEINVKNKIYREDNKDMIYTQRSKLIICECGREIARHCKSGHIKTQIHKQLMDEISLSSSSTLSE